MTASVFCNIRISGVHRWADAPSGSVLRNKHRHEFHIKAVADVDHNNRDIEFIQLKQDIISFLLSEYRSDCDGNLSDVDFGGMSCENIAEVLISKFNLSLCEVSEDGENGAIVRHQ